MSRHIARGGERQRVRLSPTRAARKANHSQPTAPIGTPDGVAATLYTPRYVGSSFGGYDRETTEDARPEEAGEPMASTTTVPKRARRRTSQPLPNTTAPGRGVGRASST